jgi:hypothetical protein
MKSPAALRWPTWIWVAGGAFALIGAEPAILTNLPPPQPMAKHLAQLKTRVPQGFTVIVQSPFVVIGDEVPEMVQQRAIRTVKWAVDKLKQDFFKQDPAEIIDIWLFRDKTSYTNHARLLFNDTPTTSFGYYSPVHRALLMNISTGGGTLVYEIVHPFMRANLPE